MGITPPQPMWVTIASMILGSGLTVSIFTLITSTFLIIPNIVIATEEAKNRLRITVTNDGFAPATHLRLIIWSSGNITGQNIIFPGESVSFMKYNPKLLVANVSSLPTDARVIVDVFFVPSTYNISAIYDQGSKYI
jgi:hypothetical protein